MNRKTEVKMRRLCRHFEIWMKDGNFQSRLFVFTSLAWFLLWKNWRSRFVTPPHNTLAFPEISVFSRFSALSQTVISRLSPKKWRKSTLYPLHYTSVDSDFLVINTDFSWICMKIFNIERFFWIIPILWPNLCTCISIFAKERLLSFTSWFDRNLELYDVWW